MNTKSTNINNQRRVLKIVMCAIILIGIFFRTYQINTDELIFDEGIYAFRSIGYLDYMESPAQKTPIEQFLHEKIPSWLYLSFHDHPPLFFIISHVFFNLFGDSVLTARLPSTLSGTLSIIIIYLITKIIFLKIPDEKIRLRAQWASLFSAGLFAVSFSTISISRISQIEAVLIFLILINLYFFLKYIDDKKWWWAFGVSFGLCMITKYTAIVLIPVYLCYLLIIHSNELKSKYFYLSLSVSALIFLPVIIYNINLYKLLGHFDLQFAYLFSQTTPEWWGTDGGKLQEPFNKIFRNLGILYSIPYLVLSLISLTFISIKKELGKIRFFIILILVFNIALLTAVGSAVRFIAVLCIPLTLAITIFLFSEKFFHEKTRLLGILAFTFILFEIYFASGLVFMQKPDYGIIKLDNYLESKFKDSRPSGLITHPNYNLNNIIKKYATKYDPTLTPVGVVYDDQISAPARLWLFSKRQFYQGIPIMPASEFLKIVNSNNSKVLNGFQIYLIKAGSATTISRINDRQYIEDLENLFNQLPEQTKQTIKTKSGETAFKISHFSM